MLGIIKFIIVLFFLNTCYKTYKYVRIPPQFQTLQVKGPREIVVLFDTRVTLSNVKFKDLTFRFHIDGQSLIFEDDLMPGRLHCFMITATNNKGYKTTLQTEFYGYNPEPAHLIFSEFTTKHSSRHRERIKFYVSKSGNLAGLTLFIGQPDEAETYWVIFPNKLVKKGEYVTCLLRSLGNLSQNFYDIFLSIDPPGLPDDYGILVLMDRFEAGKYLDAIAYVNYDILMERSLLMFSEYQKQFKWLVENDLWVGDPIETCKASPTRSLIRRHTRDDITIKSGENWYITKTRKAFSGGDTPKAYLRPLCMYHKTEILISKL